MLLLPAAAPLLTVLLHQTTSTLLLSLCLASSHRNNQPQEQRCNVGLGCVNRVTQESFRGLRLQGKCCFTLKGDHVYPSTSVVLECGSRKGSTIARLFQKEEFEQEPSCFYILLQPAGAFPLLLVGLTRKELKLPIDRECITQ